MTPDQRIYGQREGWRVIDVSGLKTGFRLWEKAQDGTASV